MVAELDTILSLHHARKWPECLAAVNAELLKAPNSHVLFNIKGSIFSANKQYKEALQYFDYAIKLKGDFEAALLNRANALGSLARLDEAANAFNDVMKLCGDSPAALIGLAQVSIRLGQIDEAKEILHRALVIDPNNSNLINDLGYLESVMGNSSVAINLFKSAISKNPDIASVHSNLGSEYQKIGNLADAIHHYKLAIQLSPKLKQAHNNLATAYYEAMEFEKARVHYLKCGDDDTTTALALECLLLKGERTLFESELKSVMSKSKSNRRVAALSAHYAAQSNKKDPYPFCPDPLDKVWTTRFINKELTDKIFEEIDVSLMDIERIWEPAAKTTRMGFRTLGNLFEQEHKVYRELELLLRTKIEEYRRLHYHDKNSLFITHFPGNFKLKGWYNELGKGGNHVTHIHPAGWLSGVLYLSNDANNSNSDEGAIEFGLEGYNYPIFSKPSDKKLFKPSRGDVVFFPSSLFHRTIPLVSDITRRAIAFDIVPLND